MNYPIYTRVLLKGLKTITPVLDKVLFPGKKKSHDPKIVFIIGVPRSGSTYLYQLLTSTGKYGYIDNLTQYLTEKSFRTALYLSNAFHKNPPHNCFKSNYGNTEECGLSAPNEGGKYFRSVRRSGTEKIKSDFQDVQLKIKKTFLVKNLYLTLQLDELIEKLPEAKFIHVVRQKKENIKSLQKARKNLNVEKGMPWSVFPDTKIDFKTEADLLNFQYDHIEKRISESKNSNFYNLSYETLRDNPDEALDKLIDFIGG